MITHSAIAQLERRLDSLINSRVNTNEPGIALFVESNRKIIYNKAFGLGDLESKSKLSPSTNFRMASVSKQFTAMCILLLEKDGKLSFDDPISKFFPELPAAVGSKILLRHLITHSSGIIDYESLMKDNETNQILDAGVLNLLKTQDTTYFKPGTRFRYSNSGYALLALITERISGKSFPEFMKIRIFSPLKMKNSMVYEADKAIPERAFGFARDKNQILFPNDQSSSSAVKGDGGVYTSLNDYRKWINSLRKSTLVDMKTATSKLNFSIRDSTNSYYGPGWFYFDKTSPSYFHSGSTCGFSTFSIQIPDHKTSIVYFSNIAGNAALFKDILEILSKEGISDASDVFKLHELTR